MGGSITPNSIHGKGTEFVIEIKTKCKLKNKNHDITSPSEDGLHSSFVFINKDHNSSEILQFYGAEKSSLLAIRRSES